jgi:hypothetical protein
MGRPLRASVEEIISHVLKWVNGRLPIFEKPGDYEAFERILAEGYERFTMRIQEMNFGPGLAISRSNLNCPSRPPRQKFEELMANS